MIFPIRTMGKLKINQPVVNAVVPVRFGTLIPIKTAPPAAKPQGVIGPLAEGPDGFARPTRGRAKGRLSVLAAAL